MSMGMVIKSKRYANCSLVIKDQSCSNQANMCSDCNCEQAQYHGSVCTVFNKIFYNYRVASDDYLDMIFLCIGFVSNILLFTTLMQRSFSGATTFLYIRIISGTFLVMFVIQLAWKIAVIYAIADQTLSLIIFNQIYPSLNDGVKLTISTFSVFLCLDRLASVASPVLYGKMKSYKFVLVVLAISTLIGTVPLWQLYVIPINTGLRPSSGLASALFYEKVDKQLVPNIVTGIRLTELVLMCGMSAIIGYRIRARHRTQQTMMGRDAAEAEYKKMRRFYTFQILETVVAAIDLMALCFFDLCMLFGSTDMMLDIHTYAEFLYYFPLQALINMASIVRDTFRQVSNFILFFLYLMFSKLFRGRFYVLIRVPSRGTSITVSEVRKVPLKSI